MFEILANGIPGAPGAYLLLHHADTNASHAAQLPGWTLPGFLVACIVSAGLALWQIRRNGRR